jgi:O-antigen/teichoic acid export membrane protein
MPEQQSSYRQIMKATSLFGGVQVFNIIISIIRSKFIAVLLGPAGMGIAGLLTSTIGIIGNLTEFGLGTSAVKNISSANATNNNTRIATVSAVLRRLVWITGLLGTLVTLILSQWLSRLVFGNTTYTLPFIWISITLLFTQLTFGQYAVLQGMRKLQYLAKANMTGSLIGLFVSIPIYYLWGINGIVPAIIISSILTLAISTYFSSKVKLEKVIVSGSMLKTEGVEMLRMGFLLSLSGLMAMGASYILRIYISRLGGVTQVGLYNAGFAIINTYVGLIFTAMGTDYYPRLSGVAHVNLKAKEAINQQGEIAILILAPILAVFLIFINWVAILFYSSKFININSMIHWAALGMFFKAASWVIAFIFLAKGASKLYFWNELIGNIYVLLFNIAGYKLAGLEGLGISFFVGYILYFFQVFIITKLKYDFTFGKEFYKIFGFQFLLGLICFFTVKFMIFPYSYIIGVVFIMVSTVFSFRELDKRIGLQSVCRSFINRISKNKGDYGS